jgi:hypothetical protein
VTEGKLRQAAFFYLHVGALYEAAVYTLAKRGVLGERLGPPWMWLLLGAGIVGVVFWALWFRRSFWTARVVWLLGLFRLPALIRGAFFPLESALLPESFYLVALGVVLLNAWMLARAGWDL